MHGHVETFHHALCFECGWEEVHRWSDEARDAADAHNTANHTVGS